MASIKIKSNQEVVLRLKACGLTNSEIKKIMEALTPMIEEKADKATTLSGYRIADAYTKDETDSLKEDMYSNIKTEISIELEKKAEKDLSNVSDDAFFEKLNAVLPDGDEVSY